MRYKLEIKFKYIYILLIASVVLAACRDDRFLPQPDNSDNVEADDRFPGYSLNVVATLDAMGGAAPALADDPEEITHWENYIDPEKFRVLFFTETDSFLFESKSRWVKKLNPSSIYSKYQVSVPIYTYGNDYYDGIFAEYDWEEIRRRLTKERFKIALLVNRPEMDYFPDYALGGENTPAGWFNNQGPFWGPDNSVATKGAVATELRTVLDLHHSQFDPLYHNKNAKGNGLGFYAPFMGNPSQAHNTGDPNSKEGLYAGDTYNLMGSTKAWIGANTASPRFSGTRNTFILPSQENPIPMYGIQIFEPIPNWEEGTPFNLSSDIDDGFAMDEYKSKMKSISLLRCVVRLDLLVPKKYASATSTEAWNEPLFVGMAYPNVNSRCEPMDIWTATDELWKKNEVHSGAGAKCEWQRIRDYGVISESSNTTVESYQKKLAWFYGVWGKHGWDYNQNNTAAGFGYSSLTKNYVAGLENTYGEFPQIFNTCIQRNAFCVADHKDGFRLDTNRAPGYWNDDQYWHYVVYCGERNINDPSTLGSTGAGANFNTIVYWMVKVPTNQAKTTFQAYAVPITQDFSDVTVPTTADATDNSHPIAYNAAVNTYADKLAGTSGQTKITDKSKYPLPLLRNHVYRIKLGNPGSRGIDTEEGTIDFNPSITISATKDISCH